MFGTLKGRFLIIFVVVAAAGWLLYSRGVKYGLDLQGGMHLALEVSDPQRTLTPEARADATDRALKIIRTRVDQFGVEEPLIQKVGADRIIVELAGITEPERAKEILQQTAFLEFQLVLPTTEVVQALPRIDRAIVNALGEEAFAAAEEPAGRQGESIQELLFGAAGDTVEGAAAEGAAPGERRPLTELLMEGGAGEFLVAEEDVPTVQRFLALPEVKQALPRGVELLFGATPEGRGAQLYRALYVLQERPFLTGEHLEDAQAGRNQQYNETVVTFQLSRQGGRIFGRVTSQHIRDRIAIVLDGEVYSAPVVQSEITTRGEIQMGQAPLEEARDLALVLRAGALPAPLEIVEERTVGPSLGADSVRDGKIAGVVGVLFVILMVGLYYKLAGLFAIGGLIVYVLLTLGGLAALNATLTAPGIAGLILSIGMAIDANVLIFERMREELALGRTVRTAVDEGFKNAMSAIVDSNLTTLITALILFQVGTGPVRGFAVTLSIGILASFFTAVYITRTFFLAYIGKRAPSTLSI